MGRILIRRAEPGDAERIARVCTEGWRDTYDGIYEPERIGVGRRRALRARAG